MIMRLKRLMFLVACIVSGRVIAFVAVVGLAGLLSRRYPGRLRYQGGETRLLNLDKISTSAGSNLCGKTAAPVHILHFILIYVWYGPFI